MRQHGIYNRWSSKNKLMNLFKSLVDGPDLEWRFMDGSLVKAHQHSTGVAGGKDESIGQSLAGNTTNIHMAVEACGLSIHVDITGGDVHDGR